MHQNLHIFIAFDVIHFDSCWHLVVAEITLLSSLNKCLKSDIHLMSSMYPGVPPNEMIKEVMTDRARKYGKTRWQLSLLLHWPALAVWFPPATQLHCWNTYTRKHIQAGSTNNTGNDK